MKHLIIFEAFESDVVSKVNKFLTKKIGKSQSHRFIEELKNLKDNFEFPINQIKDSDVQYISKKKAINIKTPSDWKPKSDYDIYAFKFWFSLEEGYLGYTGIGNKEFKFEGIGKVKVNYPFDEKEINYIKERLNIKKGVLEPVIDYKTLTHGQEVIGYFAKNHELSRLGKAKIFIQRDLLYAIQDVSSGGEPSDSSWRDWGRYSWCLGDNINSIGSDHKKLHKYTKTDDDLHIISSELSTSIFNWNLPIRNDRLSSWDDSNYGIDVIEKADFCLMINFDNIISRGYKKVSDIKKERQSSREGATALLLDEQIKDLNFNRYMDYVILKMGLKKMANIEDLKNLNKIIKTAICRKYPIYSLYSSDATWFIRHFVSDISKLIEYKGDHELFKVRERFITMRNQSFRLLKNYEDSEKSIFNSDNKDLIKVFTMIKSLNDKITQYIDNQNIETLGDVKAIYLKLIYIKELFDDDFTGMLKVRSMILQFNDSHDIHHYIEHFKDRKDLIEIDIKKLEKIEKYINSILN